MSDPVIDETMMASSLIDAAMIDGSYDAYADMSSFSANLCDVVQGEDEEMGLYGQSDDQDEEYVHRTKRLQCKTCNKSFQNKALLKKHAASLHSKDPNFECDECSKKFNRKESLTRHKLIHSGMRFFECPECGRMFNQNGHLRTHMLIHTKEKNYECLQCNMKFARKDNMKRHLLLHNRKKCHECSVCGKRFNQPGHLEAHLLIHTQEKNYQCQQCCMKFARRDTLKRHMLVHTKEKTFECDFCGEKFIQKSHLKAHDLVHTKEKNYKCPECDKKFARKGSLKRHMLGHTGERNYICVDCGKSFIQKTHLNKHQLIHLGPRKKTGEGGDEEENVDEFIQHINNVEVQIEQLSPEKSESSQDDSASSSKYSESSDERKSSDESTTSIHHHHHHHNQQHNKKDSHGGSGGNQITNNNCRQGPGPVQQASGRGTHPAENGQACKMAASLPSQKNAVHSGHMHGGMHPSVVVNPQCSVVSSGPYAPGNLAAKTHGSHIPGQTPSQDPQQMQPTNLLASSNSVMALALIDHFLTGNENQEEGGMASANAKAKANNHWMEKTQQELLAAQTLSAIGQPGHASIGLGHQPVSCNPQGVGQMPPGASHGAPKFRFPTNPEWIAQGRPLPMHPQSDVVYNVCPPGHDLFRYYSAPNVPLSHPYGTRDFGQLKDGMRMQDAGCATVDMRASPRKPKFPQKVIVPLGERPLALSIPNPIPNVGMPVYAHSKLHEEQTRSLGKP